MDERQERVGRNEALFRAVNERIEGLNETFAVVAADEVFAIVCECGDILCVEQLQIHAAEYERARADRTLFIVVPGHEDATVEAVVVDEQRGYVIVKKHPGGPADLAAERAPD